MDNPFYDEEFSTNTEAIDFAKQLYDCYDFKDFFTEAYDLMLQCTSYRECTNLQSAIRTYMVRFGVEPIIRLCSFVDYEAINFLLADREKSINEKTYQNIIIKNFDSIFPEYTFVKSEMKVNGIGRIDIFATCGERPVIIELKMDSKNPNTQLISYGSQFDNPILIGITEKPLSEQYKLPNITYYTFSDLKKRSKTWID